MDKIVEQVIYKCGDIEMSVLMDNIPENSLLDIIYRNSKEITDVFGFRIVESQNVTIFKAIEYINSPYLTRVDRELIEILDYWGVYRSYDIIYRDEKFMRDNLYNIEFLEHSMNTNYYHNLIKIDISDFAEEYNEYILLNEKPKNLLFQSNQTPLYIDKFGHICIFSFTARMGLGKHGYNYKISFLFNIARDCGVKIFIAGGYIFNNLMDITIHEKTKKKPDVDIFFVDSDENLILEYIKTVIEYLEAEYYAHGECNVKRTKNTISITNHMFPEYQFILRIYKTYSEVIHGFDVDCCCIGLDGKDMYMTERCKYAIFNGYNTVNFDLMSPSYEYRLAKYGTRGMSVYIPGIENYTIQRDILNEEYNEIYGYEIEKFNIALNITILNKVSQILYKDGQLYDMSCKFVIEYLENNPEYADLLVKCKKAMGDVRKCERYDPDIDIYFCDFISEYIHFEYNGYKDTLRFEMYNIKYVGLDLLIFLDERNKYVKYKNQIEDVCNSVSDYVENIHFVEYENEGDFSGYVRYSFITRDVGYSDRTYYHLWDEIYKETGFTEFYFELLNSISDYKEICCNVTCNDFYKSGKIFYFKSNRLDYLIVDELSYKIMNILTKVDIPRTIEFKVVKPGEQATGTFHKTVYEDRDLWYLGDFVCDLEDDSLEDGDSGCDSRED